MTAFDKIEKAYSAIDGGYAASSNPVSEQKKQGNTLARVAARAKEIRDTYEKKDNEKANNGKFDPLRVLRGVVNPFINMVLHPVRTVVGLGSVIGGSLVATELLAGKIVEKVTPKATKEATEEAVKHAWKLARGRAGKFINGPLLFLGLILTGGKLALNSAKAVESGLKGDVDGAENALMRSLEATTETAMALGGARAYGFEKGETAGVNWGRGNPLSNVWNWSKNSVVKSWDVMRTSQQEVINILATKHPGIMSRLGVNLDKTLTLDNQAPKSETPLDYKDRNADLIPEDESTYVLYTKENAGRKYKVDKIIHPQVNEGSTKPRPDLFADETGTFQIKQGENGITNVRRSITRGKNKRHFWDRTNGKGKKSAVHHSTNKQVTINKEDVSAPKMRILSDGDEQKFVMDIVKKNGSNVTMEFDSLESMEKFAYADDAMGLNRARFSETLPKGTKAKPQEKIAGDIRIDDGGKGIRGLWNKATKPFRKNRGFYDSKTAVTSKDKLGKLGRGMTHVKDKNGHLIAREEVYGLELPKDSEGNPLLRVIYEVEGKTYRHEIPVKDQNALNKVLFDQFGFGKKNMKKFGYTDALKVLPEEQKTVQFSDDISLKTWRQQNNELGKERLVLRNGKNYSLREGAEKIGSTTVGKKDIQMVRTREAGDKFKLDIEAHRENPEKAQFGWQKFKNFLKDKKIVLKGDVEEVAKGSRKITLDFKSEAERTNYIRDILGLDPAELKAGTRINTTGKDLKFNIGKKSFSLDRSEIYDRNQGRGTVTIKNRAGKSLNIDQKTLRSIDVEETQSGEIRLTFHKKQAGWDLDNRAKTRLFHENKGPVTRNPDDMTQSITFDRKLDLEEAFSQLRVKKSTLAGKGFERLKPKFQDAEPVLKPEKVTGGSPPQEPMAETSARFRKLGGKKDVKLTEYGIDYKTLKAEGMPADAENLTLGDITKYHFNEFEGKKYLELHIDQTGKFKNNGGWIKIPIDKCDREGLAFMLRDSELTQGVITEAAGKLGIPDYRLNNYILRGTQPIPTENIAKTLIYTAPIIGRDFRRIPRTALNPKGFDGAKATGVFSEPIKIDPITNSASEPIIDPLAGSFYNPVAEPLLDPFRI